MKKGTVTACIICMALGIYILAVCLGYPRAGAYGTGVPGPGLWPGVIAAGLILVSAGLLLHTVMGKRKEEDEAPGMLSEGPRRVYITMGILIIYVALLPYLGFILSSVIMLFALIQWFGTYKIWLSLPVAIAMTLIIYFVFKSLLNVPVDFGIFYL